MSQMTVELIMKDDLSLYWNSFLAGNDDAFAKIFEKLADDLLSFGATLTPDSELVKDCVQDIFFRMYQNRAQMSAVDNIKVYLLVALKNALNNTFKKHQVYRKFADTYHVEEEPIEEPEEERIIEQEYEMAMQNTTAKYLSALTERQRKIIHYRYMDGLTLEEISKLLNINYHSVANNIQRALKKMRELYLNTE